MSGPDHLALVPAAGSGARMGAALPKQYLPLAGRAVLARTLDALLAHPRVAGVTVVLAAHDPHWKALDYRAQKPLEVVRAGGASRAASVLAGLRALGREHDVHTCVLVHDAVRPLITRADLDALIVAPLDGGGAALAAPLVDTLRRALDAADGPRAGGCVPREGLWQTYTPQRARLGVLRDALEAALAAGLDPGDELAALEHAGHRPRLVQGRRDNIKLTAPADLALATAILAARAP